MEILWVLFKLWAKRVVGLVDGGLDWTTKGWALVCSYKLVHLVSSIVNHKDQSCKFLKVGGLNLPNFQISFKGFILSIMNSTGVIYVKFHF